MKYNIVLTLGGVVTCYDDMTGEPLDLDQTGCPSKILTTFDTFEEAGKFMDDYLWGRTNFPRVNGNHGVRIVEVEE